MYKMKKLFKKITRKPFLTRFATLCTLLIATLGAFAQNGQGGISSATQMVTQYFDAGITLLYAIGGVVGLIGAVKVYNAWSHGEQNTNKLAASWFGACIFLVVVASLLKTFFGLS
jgi:hypothetical protein